MGHKKHMLLNIIVVRQPGGKKPGYSICNYMPFPDRSDINCVPSLSPLLHFDLKLRIFSFVRSSISNTKGNDQLIQTHVKMVWVQFYAWLKPRRLSSVVFIFHYHQTYPQGPVNLGLQFSKFGKQKKAGVIFFIQDV